MAFGWLPEEHAQRVRDPKYGGGLIGMARDLLKHSAKSKTCQGRFRYLTEARDVSARAVAHAVASRDPRLRDDAHELRRVVDRALARFAKQCVKE